MATKKNKKLDNKKAEHDSSVQDLTQTLATVTIEKTKVEKALDERKNEVETLRQQLSDVSKDKASVDDRLKEASRKLQETEDELGQIKHEKSTLWTELVSGRERISDLEEKLKAAEKNNATLLETIREQAEEISSLKAELGRPCEIPRQPPPLPVKPSEEPPQQLQLSTIVDIKSSVSDDDAFEEGEPSPVAPCPYLSFVPLDDPRGKHKKARDKDGEDGRSKKSASSEPPPKKAEASRDRDQGLPSKEKGSTPEPLDTATGESAGGGGGEAKKLREAEREATGGGGSSAGGGEGEQATVAEQGDQEQGHRDSSEEPVAPLPEFDVVKPLQKLDSRAALHKSQVGGQIKRKKPSRDHLRQMGSSSNLLDSIPDERLEVKESSPSPSPSSTTKPERIEEEPTPQEKEKEREKDEDHEQTSHPSKQPVLAATAPSAEQKPTVAAPAHPPKPKPRAAPRRKNPEHPTSPSADTSKPLHPQAAPRQKSEGRELSPPPSESEKSGKEGVNIEEHGGGGEVHVTEEPHSARTVTQASPKIHRKEPMMPSPVLTSKAAHSPKHSPSHKKEHGSHEGEGHTPKPLPRGHGKAGKDEDPSANEAKVAELMKKDPSELTVKEKALLAQKAVGALGHDKTKLPPPVPRKPKPGHGGDGEAPPITDSEYDRGRSQSIDEKDEEHGHGRPSPLHGRKKLPPGAVNIMAGLPLPTAERGRSLTVSTTEPDARERNSLGRNASLQDYSSEKENGVRSSSQEALEQTDHSSPTKPLPKTPPKRPPFPMQKKPSNERPANVDSADNESDTSPALGRKTDAEGADNGEDESHDQSHDTGEGVEGGEESMDLNTVLTWSPEVVGQWLNSVGLGQYQELFVGVQGYMLFDMDGHRLKGLGMSSHDDRNVFKKEIKNLKPYADKHKKILEKQRKEEKKNAKKRKK